VLLSKLFLASTFFKAASSSYLAFSAEATISSILSLENLPLSLVMVIFLVVPFPFSTAVTFKMLFSSISKVTSIYGVDLGAGGIPSKLN